MQFYGTQQCAYMSFSSYFLVWFCCIEVACWVNLDQNDYFNIYYSFLTTIYERDIRIHLVVMSLVEEVLKQKW